MAQPPLWVLAGVAAVFALSGCPDPCAAVDALASPEAWELPAAADPWGSTPGTAVACGAGDFGVEDFEGQQSFTVSTAACSWLTVSQPAQVELDATYALRFRLFWFSQTVFPGGTAHLGLRVGDEELVSEDVPIPSDGSLLELAPPVQRQHPEGNPVWFHLGNHGQNTWNVLEVARVPAGCS